MQGTPSRFDLNLGLTSFPMVIPPYRVVLCPSTLQRSVTRVQAEFCIFLQIIDNVSSEM